MAWPLLLHGLGTGCRKALRGLECAESVPESKARSVWEGCRKQRLESTGRVPESKAWSVAGRVPESKAWRMPGGCRKARLGECREECVGRVPESKAWRMPGGCRKARPGVCGKSAGNKAWRVWEGCRKAWFVCRKCAGRQGFVCREVSGRRGFECVGSPVVVVGGGVRGGGVGCGKTRLRVWGGGGLRTNEDETKKLKKEKSIPKGGLLTVV